ncbi:MAG: hypothetical protein R3E45_08195 [Rhodocyclaceae bacterium]|nr:hypothetical protein [Rhodocyclaceae bacterium]MCP5240316.1 hypothetical protein [Zoogloeaceae bacterium]MCP5253575.1 hypothetical protein [Zoogloeaceae bacterium]MCP5294891.1 hypothetical protein [Zoogloeaceae bacterium]MCW5616984.1 hypothetical protein [Rhodocyclaceae bacterium]
MKNTGRKLLGVVVALVALGSALPASAEGRRGDDRQDSRREWRDNRSDRHAQAPRSRTVVRERVVERRWTSKAYRHDRHRHVYRAAPRYERRTVVRQSNHYYGNPPVAYYGRSPSLVIGFNIPPLVIPLR